MSPSSLIRLWGVKTVPVVSDMSADNVETGGVLSMTRVTDLKGSSLSAISVLRNSMRAAPSVSLSVKTNGSAAIPPADCPFT